MPRNNISFAQIFGLGLAMFSMFFGAGNIVYPLALGQYAQDQNFYSILGFLITGVGVPFIGLLSITLFDGDHNAFFKRMGKIPGFMIAAIILALLGPFGVVPRCIVVSYSTLKMYFSNIGPLYLFSLISCLVILACSYKKQAIVSLLGYVLTPILLASLAFIILIGYVSSPEAAASELPGNQVFFHGLMEGYQTMDLLAAFFFSSFIVQTIKSSLSDDEKGNYRKIVSLTLKASVIGAGLLSLVYIGFSYVASYNSELLSGLPGDRILGTLALHTLGPYAGVIVCAAVAFACLTTSIALASVFAEFVQKDVSQGKISYEASLSGTMLVAFAVSTLDFNGIASFLAPILSVCYPGLIVLSLLNIVHKLYNFKPIKLPAYSIFVGSILGYLA